MGKKILITGGCGFIGANLIPLLLKEDYQVRVLDNLSRGYLEYLEDYDIDFVQGDVRNTKDTDEASRGCDYIIHLAAFGSVVESVSEPFENFEVNAKGTLNLLNSSVKNDVSKFIFASTGGALIGDAEPPVNENSLPQPISPYGASKLCGEAYCSAFAQSYGLNTISLRFANVYGPYSAHKKGAVTAFMKSILSGKPIQIFGSGNATRDFLYVSDLCAGILSALQNKLSPGTVLHLASEVETSIYNLAQKIINISGRSDVEIEYLPKRRGEVEKNFANYDLAKRRIGFEPKVNLEKGLKKTWEWFENNKKSVFDYEATDS